MPVIKRLGSAELLYRAAERMGLHPSWVTQGGMFAFDLHGSETYVNRSISALNSHTAVSLAHNKQLTRLVLERHGFTNIPFLKTKDMSEALAFLKQHKQIIAKPNKGSGAEDIHIINSAEQLLDLKPTGYILEKYLTGGEHRYLVLEGKVIAAHISEYGTSVQADRYLERYSLTTEEWDTELVQASIKAADVIGLRFAAIDFIIDSNHKAHVLEVNSTPGLKWFHAPTTGPPVDIAGSFLECLIRDNTPSPLANSV